jgi:ribosomal protein S12 methylthiotransferase accessory factor
MNVAVVGSGPAVESVRSTLSDVEVTVTAADIDGIAGADLAIVTGLAGSDGFAAANRQSLAGGTPWIAVEVGGIGGLPIEGLDAAVSSFAPEGPCFECLRTRVSAGEVETADEPTADRAAVRLAGSYAGILAIRALSGQEMGGVVIEVPHAERTLLPVPDCACAADHERVLELDAVTRSLDESVALAEAAVDRRLGIVRQIGEHDSFPAPYYLSVLAETTGFSDGAVPDRAAGVAADWDTAFMKALGESLERYSAAIYRESSFERAPATDVNGPAPTDFVRPAGWDGPDETTPIDWVPGRDLIAETDVSLPAGLVHFPTPDERLSPTITTGLGLGNGGVEAVLSGLYEVLERDATMLAWYSSFEPLGLSVSADTFETLSRRARGEGLSVTPLLVTQDVDVPVVAVAVHREAYPKFALGSAADLDASAAAGDALAEAIQNWMELRDMGPDAAAEADGAIGEYASDPGETMAMLDTPGTVDAADVGAPEPLSGETELDRVLELVEAAGLDVYAADITPRDVASLGFAAVRVLSPQAQPLFVGDPYFGARASEVPRELGFDPRLDRSMHPYP